MISIKYRAEIETLPLEYKYTETVDDKDAEGQTDAVGKDILLYINGVQIENQNIKLLKINNDTMFPTIEIEFTDPTSHLLMDKYPVDNTILSIYKKSTNEGIMDIKMDFKIINFKTNNGVSGNQISISLKGILNVDDLYLFNFESYEGSTYEVFDILSKKMKLGYASNIENTNDKMVWINPGGYRQSFIKDIIKKSYIDDTTFLFGYIDFYYNFNYVDINKQLNMDISEQNNIEDSSSAVKDVEEQKPSPLILTNNEDKSSTNLYISKYTIKNDSTEINIDNGYRYKMTSYNKIEDKVNRYFLESISEGSDNNSITLKGNPFLEKDLLYEESINGKWMGKLDTYNVHENFLHTDIQNENNLKFLQKLKLSIKMGKPNYSLYRFQKILVELYNFGQIENEEEQNGKQPNPGEQGQYDSKIINRLSGEWLITAINFTFTRDEGNIQEITLVKRELTEEYNFPRREKKK